MLQINQLRGFGAAGEPAGIVTFVASATSTGNTVTVPAEAMVGDLALFSDSHWEDPITLATPSGWTLIKELRTFTNGGYRLSMKILEASDLGAAINPGGDQGSDRAKVLLVFRQSQTIASITASTFNGQQTGGGLSAQTISAVGQGTPLIAMSIASADTANSITLSGSGPAFAGSVLLNDGSTSYTRFDYTIFNNTPPNDFNVDYADPGDTLGNFLVSGYLLVG